MAGSELVELEPFGVALCLTCWVKDKHWGILALGRRRKAREVAMMWMPALLAKRSNEFMSVCLWKELIDTLLQALPPSQEIKSVCGQ